MILPVVNRIYTSMQLMDINLLQGQHSSSRLLMWLQRCSLTYRNIRPMALLLQQRLLRQEMLQVLWAAGVAEADKALALYVPAVLAAVVQVNETSS